MKNEKVSIIVPVYNAEQYLGYTITSILKQTYKNIEIILVNDGSKDDSLIICQNYAAIDARVKVLDVPNGGVSMRETVELSRRQESISSLLIQMM